MRVEMLERDAKAFVTPAVMADYRLMAVPANEPKMAAFDVHATAEDFADWLIDQGADAARAGKKAAGKRMCAYGDAIRYRLGLPT